MDSEFKPFTRNTELTTSITISKAEYDSLKSLKKDYDILISAMINSAELSYNKKAVTFDSGLLVSAYKLLKPDEYKLLYSRLKEEDEENE